MTTSQRPEPIKLEDYEAPAFFISSINIEIELLADKALVTSRIKGNRNENYTGINAPLVLNGENQKLISIKLDQDRLKESFYQIDDKNLTIVEVGENFDLEIISSNYPLKNKAFEGLYFSEGMYCTQCEAEGFRKITFFLDRPDILTKYTTKIIANKKSYPVLLSNGHVLEGGDLDNGRHFVVWDDPFPKPSYLFAAVAGDLACVEDTFITMSGRKVILRIFVEHGEQSRCKHAMLSLQKAMAWDEEQFGLEYDLDLFMIVAVSHFNMGAMENKGLNIFNSRYVLADIKSASDVDYQRIESIIAHEYFHNWTGNRVTCRDWFQLSLKEGLTVFRDQEFTADMHSRGVQRIKDVRTLQSLQFTEDAGPTSHPVRPNSYVEINNFYTVTVYEKGAEIVRLVKSIVGPKKFRKGIDLYFQKFDGQAITCEDFLSVMEMASGKNLLYMLPWYTQSGTPELVISLSYDAVSKETVLNIKQVNLPTSDQWKKNPLPILLEIGLLDKKGQEYPLRLKGSNKETTVYSKSLEVLEQEQSFVFTNIDGLPVPALLRGFSSPIKVKINLSYDDLFVLMTEEKDPYVRWSAGQEYSIRLILKLIEENYSIENRNLEKNYFKAIEINLLNEELEPALRAELLRIPSENDIAQKMEIIDVDGIHAARRILISNLGSSLGTSFISIYWRMLDSSSYDDLSTNSIGARALAAISLEFLVSGQKEGGVKLALEHVVLGRSMTLTMIGLIALNDQECKEREEALDIFFNRWHEKPLELDKWFSLHASSTQSATLGKVIELCSHESFDVENPNRVRSLIGTLSLNNPVNFHNVNGSGYEVLANHIIGIDSKNPQIAARLAGPLTRWKRYNKERKNLMLKQLDRIIKIKGLSNDVFEIVNKGLIEEMGK